MVKNILTAFFLLATTLVQAQSSVLPIDPTTRMVIYTEKVQVPGASVEDIYDKAHSFVYNGIESIHLVQFWGDPSTRIIHVKAGFRRKDWDQWDENVSLLLQFDLTVTCHEGYYEYSFTNFTKEPSWGPWKVEEEVGMSKEEKKQIRREAKFRKWVDKEIRYNIEKMKQWI
ncbi:MAG TPA: hypothetical protein VIM64_23245 [Puia sp.]